MNRRKIYWLSIAILMVFTFCKSPSTYETVQVQNPVLPGFYPDPSVCKGPDGYYMVHSTFGYFPGIPVFYSPDLVHWEQIGHVLTRREQLIVDGHNLASRGTYAPTIEYHNGKFYVACTEVGQRGNYITVADDPAGPWSNLYLLPEVDGIDPSLFFDDDGRTYIIFNSNPPNNNPLYSGHRTIRMFEMDMNEMKVIGEEKILVDGGVDITQEPEWIEGPHIYKVNGLYYLCAAEGGTSVNHRQVIFRSENIWGPYVPWDKNPILTQMHLDPNRTNPVTSTGHADLIQDLQGNWWAFFLACRPYEDNHYNLGRETFIAPVEWVDGWPVINPGVDEVQFSYSFGAAMPRPEGYLPLNGNFIRQDDFTSAELGFEWITIRNSTDNWYRVDAEGEGKLVMNVRPFSDVINGNPSYIGRRQQHLRGSVSTLLTFDPQRSEDKAGLAVLQNVGHFYFLCKSLEEGQPVVQLFKGEGEGMSLLASAPLLESNSAIKFKIESDLNLYRCYFATNDGAWQQIGGDLDARHLSTETAGGFVGCTYGMYAISADDVADLTAQYHWFRYEGND